MTSHPSAASIRNKLAAAAKDDDSNEEWQATRAQTQLARDEEDYLTDAHHRDIGRPVGGNLHEMFVSCDAGPAMQQQFEHSRPDFIALHDMATTSSRKLLAGVSAASNRAIQKLVIRRQSYGNTLATIEFVELPIAGGDVLRIYSTEADAESSTRHALARTLLAYSALGVVLVGDVPGHAMNSTFKPLRDDMITGPWPNRQLLLLPLSTANALVTQGMELSRGTGVNVRTTPQITRPADAWNFISSTWARLRAEMQVAGATVVRRPAASAPVPFAASTSTAPAALNSAPAPLPLRPMPPVADTATTPNDPVSRYVHQLSELTGMVSCCVFDVATGRAVAHAGASPGAADLAKHGSELLTAMISTSRTLGLGHAIPDAAITLGAHHLVLRAVPKQPGLALHAVLDKMHANLALARLQIMRMDGLFGESTY